MFKRSIINNLEEWRNSPLRKPLIIRGARQVGKTTIVHEFGKTYPNYLYYNLERRENTQLFESEIPLADLLVTLFSRSGKVRKEGDTLLFIDEIQNSPKTIALLRYFYEEMPWLHVIAAGSLLENIVDVKTSFPVGRVRYLPVRPCSFAEFVGALDQSNLLDIMYDTRLAYTIHPRLMSLFNQYVTIGGMPEVVQTYAYTRDMLAVNDVYETLLQAYRDDVEKYVKSNRLTDVVRFILERGWQKAGETVSLNNFAGSEYRSAVIGDAFRLLQKAMLLELVYPATSADIPLFTEIKRKPKLIWLDTGLVNYAAGIRNDVIRANDIVDTWRGRVAEHVVAQELLTLNDKISQRRAFWMRGNGGGSAEVDFVWQVDSMLVPIEVKSGINSHLRSLHSFIDHSHSNVAIRVWSGEYSVDEVTTVQGCKKFKLINLPFYMVGNLEYIVKTIV